MTNEQLYVLFGVPMLFNATLLGLVVALFNAKFGRVEHNSRPSKNVLTTHAICGRRSFGEWKKFSMRG